MADSTTVNGVLGNLPPLPRKPLNNSVIAAEQAFRKRKGLPVLSEEDIAALKAGEPMPWEGGDAPVITAPAASAPSAPATTPAASGAAVSATVAELTAGGRKWSKSSVAAEQARRKRTGLPPLTDAEVAALLGEAAAPAAAAPAATAPAATAQPAAAAVPAARAAAPTTSAARSGEAVRYVGTPAVGTSKAAAAGGVASVGPEDSPQNRQRRIFVWSAVAAFLTAWLLAFFRYFLP